MKHKCAELFNSFWCIFGTEIVVSALLDWHRHTLYHASPPIGPHSESQRSQTTTVKKKNLSATLHPTLCTDTKLEPETHKTTLSP